MRFLFFYTTIAVLALNLNACGNEGEIPETKTRGDTLAVLDSIPSRKEVSGDTAGRKSDTLRDSTVQGRRPKRVPDTARITHTARITTDIGRIHCGLYGKDAPKTVENFVQLARKRYYNRLPFHRVAKNFVIQTGNPKMRKSRSSEDWLHGGESAYGEPFADELNPAAPSYVNGYKRGTIAMANRGPNSNSSQFFICLRNLPELPKDYTIFGRVLSGMSIVDSIAAGEIRAMRNELDGMPLDPVYIKSIRIRKQRN